MKTVSYRQVIRLYLIAALALGLLALLIPASRASASAGTLDQSFDQGTNGSVYAVALQPNGKILIGGEFIYVGFAGRARAARLNANGALDETFRNPNFNGPVRSIVPQPDGKILMGGEFTRVAGEVRNGIARLNADGSLDGSFTNPTGVGGPVKSIALQPDGKVLIAGELGVNSQGRLEIVARLNADGTPDKTFTRVTPCGGARAVARTLALRPDGGIFAGGDFECLVDAKRAQAMNYLVRLYPDGEHAWRNPIIEGPRPGTGVYSLALRGDSTSVLASGIFSQIGDPWPDARKDVALLTERGGVDYSFINDPLIGGSQPVNSILWLPDGKYLAGGGFTEVAGQARSRVARLNPSGSLDLSFIDPGINDRVYALALQPDGKIVVGGDFTGVGGEVRFRIARLIGTSFPLTVNKSGAGTVTSSPRGIDCGSRCSADFDQESRVTLTAAPGDSAQFNGWGGACAGKSPTCEVLMSQALEVSATFGPAQNPERLGVTRSGPGRIISVPPGIDCGSDCMQFKSRGSFTTLVAEPNDDARFIDWSGDCLGGSTACNLWMTGPRSATGSFRKLPSDAKYLTVTRGGSGAGSVTSTPAGINCGDDCVQGFLNGTKVTLKANPAEDARFAGWGGSCSGSGATCTVTMNQTRGVTASFEQLPADSPVLTVTKSGTGAGTVTSSPVGINCGPDCRQGFLKDTRVTLNAEPRAGARFTGWTGACSGSSATCSVTMGQSLEVGAEFTQVATVRSVTSRKKPRNVRITSRVALAFPGKVTQRATTGAKRKLRTWCRTSKSARRASTVTLGCNLGRKARSILRKRALTVTLRTSFRPRSGGSVTLNNQIRLPRAR